MADKMPFMRRPALAVFVVILTVVAAPMAATASTPEERKWAVDTTRWLEEYPLSPEAKARTAELLKWWIAVPDLTLSACPLLLDVKNKKIGPTVATQAMLSTGAFVIEHPRGSRAEQVMAGVEGALRAYENAVKVDEKMRDKFLDELLGAKATGKLGETYVNNAVKHCEETSK
jgi:hypothetical protein